MTGTDARPARAESFATRRQEALFEQLLTMFLAQGFAQVSMADLAARLHCSKSTLYALAESKEQLVTRTVTHFFRAATEHVEEQVRHAPTARDGVITYLVAVGTELSPASEAFMVDLHAFAPTRDLYQRNTAAAARRVRELIDAGVAAGEFRDVDAGFAADLAATMMSRIQRREVAATTGIDDASAYRALASILTAGIDRPAT